MNEIWKSVNGFDYEVSNLGRVRSTRRNNKLRTLTKGNNGYWKVTLHRGGFRKTFTVHRLVADAFLGERPEGLDTRHGPGGIDDNSAQNLSYGTRSENHLDKRRDGTARERPVRRSDGIIFTSARAAAVEVNRHRTNITAALRGRAKTCAGYGWEYADDAN